MSLCHDCNHDSGKKIHFRLAQFNGPVCVETLNYIFMLYSFIYFVSNSILKDSEIKKYTFSSFIYFEANKLPSPICMLQANVVLNPKGVSRVYMVCIYQCLPFWVLFLQIWGKQSGGFITNEGAQFT